MKILIGAGTCALLNAGTSVLVGRINHSRGRDKRRWYIHAIMGGIGALCAALSQTSLHTVVILFLSQLLCEASLRDQKERRMDDAFWICALALSLSGLHRVGPIGFLFGGAAAFIPLMMVRLIGKKTGIGGADIKMACALGTFTPPLWSCAGLILSCLLAFLSQKIRNRHGDAQDGFAMIPYLSLGMGTVCMLAPYLRA